MLERILPLAAWQSRKNPKSFLTPSSVTPAKLVPMVPIGHNGVRNGSLLDGGSALLTGKLVRVRFVKDRIVPTWLDTTRPEWLDAAERLLTIFRTHGPRTRGELEDEVEEAFGDSPQQLVYRGLAKLLEDRCDFEVAAELPPEQIREAVFLAAAAARRQALGEHQVRDTFDRETILDGLSVPLGLPADQIEQGLFADLKSEQRLIRFDDTTAERLLERYNVALAQAVLLRSSGLEVRVRGETPARYRQLLRLVKFHRLVCDVVDGAPGEYVLRLDGPLSLFSATQKYGLQLALFLPAVLRCHDFELRAELSWGPQRLARTFVLSPADGLVPEGADRGVYVPPELAMFVELFRKKAGDWDISEETDLLPLGSTFWVPDFRLVHRPSGQVVYLDVLGFWRRSHAEKHLQRLRAHARAPFVLAVSEQLHVDEELAGLPAGIHRFRQMPLPDEVKRLAEEALRAGPGA
jgi:predicted nuclease of restriction endonuclease-like RecB superfamily